MQEKNKKLTCKCDTICVILQSNYIQICNYCCMVGCSKGLKLPFNHKITFENSFTICSHQKSNNTCHKHGLLSSYLYSWQQ